MFKILLFLLYISVSHGDEIKNGEKICVVETDNTATLTDCSWSESEEQDFDVDERQCGVLEYFKEHWRECWKMHITPFELDSLTDEDLEQVISGKKTIDEITNDIIDEDGIY